MSNAENWKSIGELARKMVEKQRQANEPDHATQDA